MCQVASVTLKMSEMGTFETEQNIKEELESYKLFIDISFIQQRYYSTLTAKGYM
jgi:hypothetical protein